MLGTLLTKWTLIGVLQSNKTLYSTHDQHGEQINVKMAFLSKNGKAGYIIYHRISTNSSSSYKLINADIASDLFNTGMFIEGATLEELDENF